MYRTDVCLGLHMIHMPRNAMLCKDEGAHDIQRDGAFQCIRDGLRRKHVRTACLVRSRNVQFAPTAPAARWMNIILAQFDDMVRNVANSSRLQDAISQ